MSVLAACIVLKQSRVCTNFERYMQTASWCVVMNYKYCKMQKVLCCRLYNCEIVAIHDVCSGKVRSYYY
jgi:hypothetical protein